MNFQSLVNYIRESKNLNEKDDQLFQKLKILKKKKTKYYKKYILFTVKTSLKVKDELFFVNYILLG